MNCSCKLLAATFLTVTLCVLSSTIATPNEAAHSAVEVSPSVKLTVALYPYVPRRDQFQAAITAAWNAKHPKITLVFEDHNFYDEDPPTSVDVFVFDAILLDYFQAQGFLAPIQDREVEDLPDFLSYAIKGSRIGQKLYGIPQLGCSDLLFFRKGDEELAKATTLSALVRAVGEDTYTGNQPPPGKGLLVDLSSKTGDACFYVEALENIFGLYTSTPPLPPQANSIDPWAIQNVHTLLRMASKEDATYSSDAQPYQRGTWFGQGLGRALVGFPETMSAMGDAGRSSVQFKFLPLSDRTGASLFYVDIVGINSSTVRNHKRALALELANMMASKKVMLQSIGPSGNVTYPQYLMPVRASVFRDLSRQFPLYRRMHGLVSSATPHLFRLGPTSRKWLTDMKKTIQEEIMQPPVCATPSQ